MNTISWRKAFAALILPLPLALCVFINRIEEVRASTTDGDSIKISSLSPLLPIPLEQARSLLLPSPKSTLVPVPFQSGKKIHGWIVQLPENHTLCTPAYYRGKLYLGGGYGSHEFYAFDAATGKLATLCCAPICILENTTGISKSAQISFRRQ
jgi:hypothetical protein